MNWIEKLERNKYLVVGAIVFIAFSTLIVATMRNPIALDPFWHMQMGRDWIENGLSPWVDHYSFTYNGHAIANPPVVFQVLLHFVVTWLGISSGFLLIKLSAFLLVFFGTLLLLRHLKAPALVYAVILPALVLSLQFRVVVRPELYSFVFALVALMFYFRAGQRVSMRQTVMMSLLMLLWTNYHSPVIGYVILFGFYIDCAVAQATASKANA